MTSKNYGPTTLSITTFSITTLSIMGLFVTLSKNGTQITVLSAIMPSVAIMSVAECRYAECWYVECHGAKIIPLYALFENTENNNR